MHPTAHGSGEVGWVTGPDAFLEMFYEPFLATFPDLQVKIDLAIAEGADVVVRWTATGTHRGELHGIAPTGWKITFSGMTWQRWENGQLVSGWDRFNLHALLKMLQTGGPTQFVRLADGPDSV